MGPGLDQGPSGPGPKWAWAQGGPVPSGPGPKWARAQVGQGPKWAQGPSGPRAQVGPGPKWARAQVGPGPKWARAQVGPGPSPSDSQMALALALANLRFDKIANHKGGGMPRIFLEHLEAVAEYAHLGVCF